MKIEVLVFPQRDRDDGGPEQQKNQRILQLVEYDLDKSPARSFG